MRLVPNTITLLGFPAGLLAGSFLYKGAFLSSAAFLLLLCACDVLDGALAKKKGLSTPFGAFLDSTVDRATEFFLFMGALFYYFKEGSVEMAVVTYGALTGSFLVSYTRARAENFIKNCRVGFWERPERLLLFLLGLLGGRLKTSLGILFIGSTLTALDRILHTRHALQHDEKDLFETNATSLPLYRKILFWRYPRRSWPYRIYAGVVVLLTLTVKLP
ncbi:MAG: CDP-alcohol phosphatidyltransferase family protein [Candidatus Omnitrophica bacterium]|nr:CDP-alcohol phosphatidyltransferase family protein [Candidatus Omnitrophota bacterium]